MNKSTRFCRGSSLLPKASKLFVEGMVHMGVAILQKDVFLVMCFPFRTAVIIVPFGQ